MITSSGSCHGAAQYVKHRALRLYAIKTTSLSHQVPGDIQLSNNIRKALLINEENPLEAKYRCVCVSSRAWNSWIDHLILIKIKTHSNLYPINSMQGSLDPFQGGGEHLFVIFDNQVVYKRLKSRLAPGARGCTQFLFAWHDMRPRHTSSVCAYSLTIHQAWKWAVKGIRRREDAPSFYPNSAGGGR